uniref:F-box domain-containing protein n=1 Tax=Bionectria ochroleuca TaxID=29856 RepID=A0A8H7TVC4_BIOOC
MSSSAMDASLRQSKPHLTGLLDLPNELLTGIASLVDHGLIPSLRLVCRQLDPIASPFLIHTISVGQTQESLDRVQGILEKPHIASGVRGITVTLAHRFSPLVQDKSLFTQVLEDCMLHRDYHRCSEREPSESASEYRLRTLPERRELFMRSEDEEHGWQEKWPQMRVDETRPNDAMEKYERLIQSAYDLVSFTERPVTLKFETVLDSQLRTGAPSPEAMFLYFMSNIPCLFSLQEKYRKAVEDDMVLQDVIIWDLPITLHKAGRILHTFVLDNVLKIMGDAVLFADALSPSNNKLNELRQALQNLNELDIKGMMHMNMGLGETSDLNHVGEPPAERLMFGDLLLVLGNLGRSTKAQCNFE